MQYPPQISIDSLIMHLIDTLIHWIEIIPSWIGNGVPYGHLFAEDLRQLHAIHSQLRMHLCTRPLHPWADEAWKTNLILLLAQSIRQSRHCLQKLISFSPSLPSIYLYSLTGMGHDLSLYLSYAVELVKTFPPYSTGIPASKANL